MKKTSLFLFIILLGMVFKSYSQTAATTPTSTDFFAGNWEITIFGTPDGDAKMIAELIRKDGKLTGELKDPAGTRPAVPLTKVEEGNENILLYFVAEQAGEISIELTKVDSDHLKGQLMSMFDATGLRVKK